MAVDRGTITVLLRAWSDGDRAAFDELMPLIYGELRRLAARHLRGERDGHSLRPTELVSEAYLRLLGASVPGEWSGRGHFLAIAARAMRQILVDHARRGRANKRGAGVKPATLDEAIPSADHVEQIVAIDLALEALSQLDDRKARVLEMHHFGGLTQPEIAELLKLHVNTVARDLRFAEAWIASRIRGEPGES